MDFSNCRAIQDIFSVKKNPQLIPARLECWNILCVDIHYGIEDQENGSGFFFYNGELNFGPLLYLFSFFIVYYFFIIIFFIRLRRQDYPSEDIWQIAEGRKK